MGDQAEALTSIIQLRGTDRNARHGCREKQSDSGSIIHLFLKEEVPHVTIK